MRRVALPAVLISFPLLGQFTVIPSPTVSYTGATSLVSITAPNGTSVSSLSGSGQTLGFSTALTAATVGVSGWSTWGSPPDTESSTPRVLARYTSLTSLTIDLSSPTGIFGFEIEPDTFGLFTIGATFYSGSTLLGSISQDVNGNAGARLFAATSTTPIDRVVVTSPSGANGFALAQFRFATPAPAPISSPVATPLLGDAALAGLLILLAAAGAVLVGRRRPA